jgi:hypothetical protein
MNFIAHLYSPTYFGRTRDHHQAFSKNANVTKVAQKVMPHIFFSFQNKDSDVKIER